MDISLSRTVSPCDVRRHSAVQCSYTTRNNNDKMIIHDQRVITVRLCVHINTRVGVVLQSVDTCGVTV